MRAADIVGSTELPRTVVTRLLNTLVEEGYVVRLPIGTYSLGLQAVRLGAAGRKSLGINRTALPFLIELARRTPETVNLNVLDRRAWMAVCVESVDGIDRIRYSMDLGSAGYLHAGATRKVILAHLKEEEVEKVIDRHGLPALTAQTITGRSELLDKLAQIHDQGWDISEGESQDQGVACAAPIVASNEIVVGSVGLIGPSYRFTPAHATEVVPIVVETAQAITDALSSIPSGMPYEVTG